MKLKNKTARLSLLAALMLMFTAVFTGCAGSSDSLIEKEVNPQIDVYGVKIYMDEQKVHESVGSQGERAMCVYGYEYEYADKDINIGFNAETKQVRRVGTKNPETSIYGIKPGVDLETAYKALETNGFAKDEDSKYVFRKENVIFTITSMKGTNADGLTIELDPNQK